MTADQIEAEKQTLRVKALELGVPRHLIAGLVRYIVEGVKPGDFLQAVLSNDLMKAAGRGDGQSIAGLKALCLFLYNDAPNACHGSPENVADWCERQPKKAGAGAA